MNHPKIVLCPTVGKLSTVIDVIVTVVHPNTCIRSKCWSNGVLGVVFSFSKHVFVIIIYIFTYTERRGMIIQGEYWATTMERLQRYEMVLVKPKPG